MCYNGILLICSFFAPLRVTIWPESIAYVRLYQFCVWGRSLRLAGVPQAVPMGAKSVIPAAEGTCWASAVQHLYWPATVGGAQGLGLDANNARSSKVQRLGHGIMSGATLQTQLSPPFSPTSATLCLTHHQWILTQKQHKHTSYTGMPAHACTAVLWAQTCA